MTSGYLVKIEVFIPADPHKIGTMEDAMLLINALSWPESIGDPVHGARKLEHFGAEWTVTAQRWIARRKSAPPVPAERPAVAEAGDNAAHAAESPAIDLTIPAEMRRT